MKLAHGLFKEIEDPMYKNTFDMGLLCAPDFLSKNEREKTLLDYYKHISRLTGLIKEPVTLWQLSASFSKDQNNVLRVIADRC